VAGASKDHRQIEKERKMRSMTGFGRGKARLGRGHLVVEIKSVNHRFVDIKTRAPHELLSAESAIERQLRRRLSRGACTVEISFKGSSGERAILDKAALRAHLESLIEVSTETDLVLTDLIPALTTAQDLFTFPHAANDDEFENALIEACDKALDNLVEMRQSEGEAMKTTLETLVTELEATLRTMNELSDEWPSMTKERIRQRIETLIGQSNGAHLDEGRLEQEVAIAVSRADVTEEFTRMDSHIGQLTELLTRDGPIGRRMEFIIQEMGRETNTIGSKVGLSTISTLVVDTKTTLEKIRELAQNCE